MGISISGGVRRTIINGIIVDDFKDIGIENAGGRIFSVNDFTSSAFIWAKPIKDNNESERNNNFFMVIL